RLVIVQIVEDDPRLPPVDRHDIAGATRVEREVDLGRLAFNEGQEFGSADEGRLDTLHLGRPDELRPDLAANFGATAVTADEIPAADGHGLVVVEITPI